MRSSLVALLLISTALHAQPARPPLSGHAEWVTYLAFSPDGKTLASASHDRTIKLWDVVTAKENGTLTGHTGWVESLAFSPDGKTLASAGFDRTIRLWDARTREEIARIENAHAFEITSIAFSPDGKTLATGSQGADEGGKPQAGDIRLWDVGTCKENRQLPGGHPYDVWDVAFSPDGKTLVSCGGPIKQQGEIVLWDLANGQPSKPLRGHEKPITAIAISADGKTLVSASEDRTAKVWTSVGKERLTLKGHTDVVVGVAVSSDGKVIATAGRDRTVRLWDGTTGMELAKLTGHTDQVRTVALSRDGKTLASGGDDKTIRLWDVAAAMKKP